jgi:nucleoside phosphorylase
VHYGVIASGNELIKNAAERDRLGEALGAKCVEMEAAGLMNEFPCIVIRGICDYADAHKNDVWQKYAATTAAAFAKELLLVVRPTEVAGTKHAADVMSESNQASP